MRTELSFLAASALINLALLQALEHSAVHFEENTAKLKAQAAAKKAAAGGPIAFEYVEAPKTRPQKPATKTARISERDAVNRDALKDKALAENLPQTAKTGPTNQLSQKKGNASPAMPASPEVMPQPPQQTAPPASEISGDGPIIPQNPVQPRTPQPARQAQEARPAAKPGEGSDRITTQEMAKLRSRGAQIEGLTSFEATGSGMGVYMKNLKEKIWLAWFPYLVAHYPKDFQTADAVVSFKLDAQGQVKIVEIVSSKGSPLFAAFCMEAVQRAGSFGPLPEEILAIVGDELEIKFAFHYK